MVTTALTELRVFALAASLGSVSAAARQLGITQQAASARIRAFERASGAPLLVRSSAGVTLTETGSTVFDWVAEVLDAADRLDEGLATLRDGVAGSLTVGASQTIASHLLPGWLVSLRQQQLAASDHATQVSLITANSQDVIARVRGGTIDLGFVESPSVPIGVGRAVIGSDSLVVAVAPAHPWALLDSVSLEEVCATPLVSREVGSGTRDTLEASAARAGLSCAVPATVLATEAAVRSAVAHGVAPAAVSSLSVRDDVRLGRIVAVPFAGTAPARPLTAVWRGGDLVGARRALVAVAAAALAT